MLGDGSLQHWTAIADMRAIFDSVVVTPSWGKGSGTEAGLGQQWVASPCIVLCDGEHCPGIST